MVLWFPKIYFILCVNYHLRKLKELARTGTYNHTDDSQ